MNNPTVFTIATSILDKEKSINIADSCIKFASGKIFLTNKAVLLQLELFKNISNDLSNFPKINELDIVLEINEGKNFVNEITFIFFYERLKKIYFARSPINYDLQINHYQEQLNYIYLIDYLTNPVERNELFFLDIVWHELFWVNLLSIQFPNISTFFNRNDLMLGYCKSIKVIESETNISEQQEDDIKNYFGYYFKY